MMNRILFYHDLPCTLVYLIEKAPWMKKSSNKSIMRFENGVWKTIQMEDLPILSKIEAQVFYCFTCLIKGMAIFI